MKTGEGLFSLAAAIVGVALIATVVQSKNTAAVIKASGDAFVGAVRAAMGR